MQMIDPRARFWVMAEAIAACVCLTACEPRNEKAAAPPPTGPQDRALARDMASATVPEPSQRTRRAAAAPLYNGKPMWADNRRGTAEENARYQFEHRGADVGARDVQDYIAKVHAFFDHPPKDAESVVRPSNGDLLIYSESANLFGVVRKDGAPRLFMKPAAGKTYWEVQKAEGSMAARGSAAAR